MADNNINIGLKPRRMTYETAFSLNNNKIPPQANDVEECVLGALILSQDAVSNVIDRLKVDYFYDFAHKEIFSAIEDLFHDARPVDAVTIAEKLKKKGMLDKIGGSYKISTLAAHVTSAAHIEYYVSILAEKYIQRELIRVSTETLTLAYDETQDIVDLLDKTETRFLEINDNNFNTSTQNISGLLNDAIRELQEISTSDGGALGVQTGFMELDKQINGFQPGTLIILAARPAMGKTAFAVSMARNIAVDFRKPVAIFSLEMTAMELTMRLISSEVGVNGHELKRGENLNEQTIKNVKEKTKILADAPIFIDDNPGLSIFDLRAKCRRLKQKYDIQMVFIDYLQLMSAGEGKGNGNREQEISFISRQLKALSKELGIPILALSQLSRAVETRGGDKKPVLSDLRESGAIEQDADIVMFIYRPEYYGVTEDEQGSTQGIAYINIAKNRAGSVGNARLGFQGSTTRFHNLEDFSMPSFSTDSLGPNSSFDVATGTMTVGSSMNDDISPLDMEDDSVF